MWTCVENRPVDIITHQLVSVTPMYMIGMSGQSHRDRKFTVVSVTSVSFTWLWVNQLEQAMHDWTLDGYVGASIKGTGGLNLIALNLAVGSFSCDSHWFSFLDHSVYQWCCCMSESFHHNLPWPSRSTLHQSVACHLMPAWLQMPEELPQLPKDAGRRPLPLTLFLALFSLINVGLNVLI